MLPGILRAQLGNDNPTGAAGSFNGSITTACAYDPLTGNSFRNLVDLAVTNSVGTYPLAFGRTANSRTQAYEDFQFGAAGCWRHSYSWNIDGSESGSSPSFQPTYYTVSFPDGREVTFAYSSSDNYFRGPPGVSERFQPLNLDPALSVHLQLPSPGDHRPSWVAHDAEL